MRDLADSAFALVFPAACPVCGEEHTQAGWIGLCETCWGQIQPWTGPACASCGLPFAADTATQGVDSYCGACRRGEHKFDLARSYGVYTEPLRSAILLLKFQRRERLGIRLGALLSDLWAALPLSTGADSPLLVPVPLDSSRQRARGFNQAEVLAHGLARALRTRLTNLSLQPDARLLQRTRATPPQTGLSLQARRENVRGAFEAKVSGRARGRVVVLVDDVMTTGATLSSCASALRDAGASRILAMTLARATPQFPDAGSPQTAETVDDSG